MADLSRASKEWLKERIKYFEAELEKQRRYKRDRKIELKRAVSKVKEKNELIKKYEQILLDLTNLVGRSDWEV